MLRPRFFCLNKYDSQKGGLEEKPGKHLDLQKETIIFADRLFNYYPNK